MEENIDYKPLDDKISLVKETFEKETNTPMLLDKNILDYYRSAYTINPDNALLLIDDMASKLTTNTKKYHKCNYAKVSYNISCKQMFFLIDIQET